MEREKSTTEPLQKHENQEEQDIEEQWTKREM
jgi:hypothetical protein